MGHAIVDEAGHGTAEEGYAVNRFFVAGDII